MLDRRHGDGSGAWNQPRRGSDAAGRCSGWACLGGGAAFSPPRSAAQRAGSSSGSVTDAYELLRLMMDKYAKGSTTRLVQSFDGKVPLGVSRLPSSYDDALFIDALLARIVRRRRALGVVGNAFLYLQAYDKAKDGRLRAAYGPKPLRNRGDIKVYDNTSDAGNMAWVGEALVQLYAKTSNASFLNGALAIATGWKFTRRHARPRRLHGGYTARGKKIEWKSTDTTSTSTRSLRCWPRSPMSRNGRRTPRGRKGSWPRCGIRATGVSTSEPATTVSRRTSPSSPKT